MLVSVKWLRDYASFSLRIEELTDRLTMVGLEVDAVEQRYESLQNVVTARLESFHKHPQADRLHVCEVSSGGKTYQVTCGAPNLVPGAIVALALPGAQLPSGVLIQETRIRGELSQGMLCSQRELELGEDAAGIWCLPPETPLGVPLGEALGISDTVLDVAITPNRSDCLSILGVAREVAAICGQTLDYPHIVLKESGPAIDSLSSVTIDDASGCPRYAARILDGVAIGPSPDWLRRRLESVGLRSINNIVDVTNFVLMELGQPLHAFDFDRLEEHRIVVRRAREGERFTTLDGVERTLLDDTLMICDGRKPVAVAGIMGGQESEITTTTTRVLIESAYFQPQSIRRTSKKLGLRSESSYRFERGVDPEGVIRALDRAAQLMLEVGGGRLATGRIDVYPVALIQPELILRVERTNRFLGTAFSALEMARILRSIEMQVQVLDDQRLQVTPPPFRQDVTREVDLMEEIARLAGYDKIPSSYPQVILYGEAPNPHLADRECTRAVLAGCGFFEATNYSFVAQQSLDQLRLPPEDRRTQPLKLQNPLSEDQAVMRTSLLPGLLHTAQRNLDHRNVNLRLFELSKVFLPSDRELPEERFQLTGLMTGMRNPQVLYGAEQKVDFTDLKGIVETILRQFQLNECRFRTDQLEPYVDPWGAASLWCGSQRLGVLGRLHAEVEKSFDLKAPVFIFEVDFDNLYELKKPPSLYQPLPKFPSVTRDMALIVDELVAVQRPMDFLQEQQEPLLEHLEVFDLYQHQQLGEGKKSVGYRLVYRAADRNLTDEEVNALHTGLVEKVLQAFGARLR
jgi:phenylalanyl-tRNA synthetase beta chain